MPLLPTLPAVLTVVLLAICGRVEAREPQEVRSEEPASAPSSAPAGSCQGRCADRRDRCVQECAADEPRAVEARESCGTRCARLLSRCLGSCAGSRGPPPAAPPVLDTRGDATGLEVGRSSPLEGWLGVAASGFFPLGDWAEHPYAGTLAPRDLTFFGPGPGAAVEGGFKYKRALFSLRFDFANLTTGAWEEFARQHGNEVHSRAYLFALHVSVFYRLLALRRFHLDLGLGLGYAQGAGSETDSTRALDYGYSFFSPTFSFRQSLAVGLQLHRSIDLLLMLDHTVSAQSGVEYGQEEAGPLWGITLGLGARFWFGRSKE